MSKILHYTEMFSTESTNNTQIIPYSVETRGTDCLKLTNP